MATMKRKPAGAAAKKATTKRSTARKGGSQGDNGGGGEEAIDTLKELLVDEMKDILSAEQQILKALPKMSKKAKSPDLKAALDEHLRITEGQVRRLEQAFKKLGENAKAKPCKAMQGLIAEGNEMMAEKMDPDSMDAAIIGVAQKVEHYEIASYGTVRTWARRIGEEDVAELLQETLDEEGEADKRLTDIAESQVNAAAAEPGDGE